MRFGKCLAAVAAVAMATSPALAASANQAPSLAVSKTVRSGSHSADKNDLTGGGIIVAIVALAAVVAGIIIVADSDDSPNSP